MRSIMEKTRSYLARSFIICSLLSIFPILAGGQGTGDDIRIDTDLLTFEVSVADKNGKPVRGLAPSDFEVLVSGEKREIDFFRPIKKQDAERPLSVVFALDVSGSITRDELDNLRGAMQKFVDRLADYNSYFAVMTFGMKVKTLRSFTNNPRKIRKSFQNILKVDDGLSTHAYDAVDEAIRMIQRKSPKMLNRRIPKRVVIVITDGYPVGDTVSPATVIERANDAETSVYGVILPSYSRLSAPGRPVLTLLEASGLIGRTGGRSLYATEKDFEPLFRALAEEITASYALAFYPKDEELDGESRRVNIRIDGQDLIVTQNKEAFRISKRQ